jgi:hypothetical protein
VAGYNVNCRFRKQPDGHFYECSPRKASKPKKKRKENAYYKKLRDENMAEFSLK